VSAGLALNRRRTPAGRRQRLFSRHLFPDVTQLTQRVGYLRYPTKTAVVEAQRRWIPHYNYLLIARKHFPA